MLASILPRIACFELLDSNCLRNSTCWLVLKCDRHGVVKNLDVIFWKCLWKWKRRRALFSLWRLVAVCGDFSVIFAWPKNLRTSTIFSYSKESTWFCDSLLMSHEHFLIRNHVFSCLVMNCYKNNRNFNLWILFIYKLFFDYSRRREFGPLIKLTNPMSHRNES